MNLRSIPALLALATLSLGVSAQEYFVKELTFPAGTTPEQKIEMASRLVPSDKQMAWQNLELTAFLHFGVNTFTNREWGDGQEDPAVFNPTDLDTDQWVKTLKDAGFKLVLLTAKHHDGFCLWPTATTDHSVKNSSWLNGQGDVVRMLRESCDKYGMRMGVYLSPWDRNAESYGDSPRYNDMFVAQLTELLSNYGTIDEVWFDGACGEGPNGKKQVYDWARFKKTIEDLQPGAVMAIMGDDVRWVGNEHGEGRETEWSTTVLTPGILPGAEEKNAALGVNNLSKNIGSRDMIEKADAIHWWPSEVDVSIRPGWFYHATEQPKPLRDLATIYLNSVGRNSVLLLNIPPDTDGRINQADVERLKEFRQWIDSNFSDNLKGRQDATVNCAVIEEDITKGQRVEEFEVVAWNGGVPSTVAKGTTIGKKRILTFDSVTPDSVTLDVKSWRGDNWHADITALHNVKMPDRKVDTKGDFTRLSRKGWKVLDLPRHTYTNAAAAIDGNESTVAVSSQPGLNSPLVVDLGKTEPVAGFTYLPDAKAGAGMMFKYRFFTYDENTHTWNQVKLNNEFSNIINNPIEQVVYLPETVNTRYVMLLPLGEANGRDHVSVAEFGILTH